MVGLACDQLRNLTTNAARAPGDYDTKVALIYNSLHNTLSNIGGYVLSQVGSVGSR